MAVGLAMQAPRALATGSCRHGGEPLPARPCLQEFEGRTHAVGCHGGAAAAEGIADADLAGYYRLRDAGGGRVRDDLPDLSVWDRDDVQAQPSRAVAGGRQITLLTDGMRCAACAWLIDRALRREPGVLDCGANAVTGRIHISWDPARTALSAPLQRLAMLGYRPYLAGSVEAERERTRERRRWLLRLGVAGLGTLQAMMLAEALYLDVNATMPVPTRDLFRWLTFLVSTPVVFYSGWPFLIGAWRELRNRHLGMDTLIAGSTLLAYFASLVETIRGGTHVWYDAAVMFVFLLLAARMLEQRAASSRLRRMSQSENSTMASAEQPARPGPVGRAPHRHRQQQVKRGGDDKGLEGAEVAALDQVGGVAQLLGADLPAHRRAQHDDDDLAHQRRPHLLQRGRQHHPCEGLHPVHGQAGSGLELALAGGVDIRTDDFG